jgi:cation diffusion facilitator family transporter
MQDHHQPELSRLLQVRPKKVNVAVVVSFAMGVLVAIAKTCAAAITGSASLLAEAAHSWADAGNEVFLIIGYKEAQHEETPKHPFGRGRDAYVWSMLAAVGMFVAGGVVSIVHGIHDLVNPVETRDFMTGYIVLGIALAAVAISFHRDMRQIRHEAHFFDRRILEQIVTTSDPALRGVFVEDLAALIGVFIAALGLGLTQLTGSNVPDATGSIVIGTMLCVAAILLINRNRWQLIGEEPPPAIRAAVMQGFDEDPDVERVTELRIVIVGPLRVTIIAAVDLTDDDRETAVADRLARIRSRWEGFPVVSRILVTLASPNAPALEALPA